MSEWISVRDKMPERGQLIVASFKPVHKRGYDGLSRLYEAGTSPVFRGSREMDFWMPLPEPPLGEQI